MLELSDIEEKDSIPTALAMIADLKTDNERYMVAAATVFHKEEPNAARMRYIKEYYQAASDGLFSHFLTPMIFSSVLPPK